MKSFRSPRRQEANLAHKAVQVMALKGAIEGDGAGLKLPKHDGEELPRGAAGAGRTAPRVSGAANGGARRA
eukprot:7369717-Pyramimonas_sp.AAC.1